MDKIKKILHKLPTRVRGGIGITLFIILSPLVVLAALWDTVQDFWDNFLVEFYAWVGPFKEFWTMLKEGKE